VLTPPASVTVTVIVLVPLTLATGVSVIVRLAPLPPKAIPPAATTPKFDDVAVTVSAADKAAHTGNRRSTRLRKDCATVTVRIGRIAA
jgi:hypothetical protein